MAARLQTHGCEGINPFERASKALRPVPGTPEGVSPTLAQGRGTLPQGEGHPPETVLRPAANCLNTLERVGGATGPGGMALSRATKPSAGRTDDPQPRLKDPPARVQRLGSIGAEARQHRCRASRPRVRDPNHSLGPFEGGFLGNSQAIFLVKGAFMRCSGYLLLRKLHQKLTICLRLKGSGPLPCFVVDIDAGDFTVPEPGID